MKKCALVIGHKKSSPGASNKNSNISEFEFNESIAIEIEKRVQNVFIQKVYRRTYDLLPSDINQFDPDFIISLHCNAFNENVSGTEVLYYHKSQKGKEMARVLQTHLLNALNLNKSKDYRR